MKPVPRDILLIEEDACDIEMTLREFAAHDFDQQVLVLTDSAAALRFVLGRANGVTDAANGTAGLRAILIGWKLSKLSGLDVLRQLKGTERTRRIPTFLLLSSELDVPYLAKQSVQPDGYLIKPVGFEDFVRKFGPAAVRRFHDTQVTFNPGGS